MLLMGVVMVRTDDHDRLVDTMDEFCARVRISCRTFYALLERDEAPPVVRIGRRVLIRREAGEAWLKARETVTV
jgi:excisionase family DNA binding protein